MNLLVQSAELIWSPVDPDGYFSPPKSHYNGDCGLDLATSERTVIPPGKFVKIPTNVRIFLPRGVWCMITGRSSTFTKGLITINGIIDNGYTGPLFASVFNTTGEPVVAERGDRLIQMIMFNLITREPMVVSREQFDELAASRERGDNGFGSTGK